MLKIIYLPKFSFRVYKGRSNQNRCVHAFHLFTFGERSNLVKAGRLGTAVSARLGPLVSISHPCYIC